MPQKADNSDETVEKIVHDCRMDSDALFHKLGITLTHVHDTQSWYMQKNRYLRVDQ